MLLKVSRVTDCKLPHYEFCQLLLQYIHRVWTRLVHFCIYNLNYADFSSKNCLKLQNFVSFFSFCLIFFPFFWQLWDVKSWLVKGPFEMTFSSRRGQGNLPNLCECPLSWQRRRSGGREEFCTPSGEERLLIQSIWGKRNQLAIIRHRSSTVFACVMRLCYLPDFECHLGDRHKKCRFSASLSSRKDHCSASWSEAGPPGFTFRSGGVCVVFALRQMAAPPCASYENHSKDEREFFFLVAKQPFFSSSPFPNPSSSSSSFFSSLNGQFMEHLRERMALMSLKF